LAISKLKKLKSGSDQILAEPNQAGAETLLSEIRKPKNFIWNKEELPEQWKEHIIVSTNKQNKLRGP
jgi:hypothetical protein